MAAFAFIMDDKVFLTQEINKIIKQPVISGHIYKGGPLTQIQLAKHVCNHGKNVIITVPLSADVRIYRRLLQTLFPEKGLFYKHKTIFWPGLQPGEKTNWAGHWQALATLLLNDDPKIIVMPLENLVLKWPDPLEFEQVLFYLQAGEEKAPDTIVEFLIEHGYERTNFVSRMGEFAWRGDILDIFAPGYEYPVRIDFFGELIESIKDFEPLSQRSKQSLTEMLILPYGSSSTVSKSGAREVWQAWSGIGELGDRGKNFLESKMDEHDPHFVPGLWGAGQSSLLEWLETNAVFFFVQARDMRSRLDESHWLWHSHYEAVDKRWPWQDLLVAPSELRRGLAEKPQLLFDDLVMGETVQGIELQEDIFTSFEQLFWEPVKRQRPLRSLVENLKQWKQDWNQVVLCFKNNHSRRRFLDFAKEEGLHFFESYSPEQQGLFALIGELRRGMFCVWNKVAVFSENIIQPSKNKQHQKTGQAFAGLTAFDDLNPEDLLVHRDYGLSRFGGLHRLKIGKVANDYLLLHFAREDKLYLPVDRLGLVQRYKGPEGASPALDKLGGSSWSKAKSRVRKAIEKIAHDLVAMYAYRKVAKSYNYDSLPSLYREFELSFGFDETPGQEQAIEAVLQDMQSPEPMDRLVCGDVGFGKTEVAMRAAFRAFVDGKQVALLCPTTVLAEQHFQNFKRRMQPFSVRIGMLSRFVSLKQQKLTLKAAKEGEIDILIGTHRLLSNDVVLPKLALLVLDEEQRFGVKHKERLKRMRQDIDVLTLTATPIPRTLQLSLSGIRSLSTIETPPVDRLPVQTALMEKNPSELKAIVKRELDRGGQVFWVYNRVQGLEQVRDFVQSLVPEAKVGMAHGKMGAKELEETMHGFWHGELDVLVCTAIIESGLDFPKANTLIVDQAQLFGLGQLYQLRGRVGRSSTKAYAYFIVPSLDSLSEQAKKRMRIILNLDYLGAGFQVAMEDLRLRGAGNLLGEVQSGNMGKVGLDMFLEMLEEEVARQKGEPVAQIVEPEMNIAVTAHIPENYIVEANSRLHYYKQLSSSKKIQDIDALVEEVQDRFGPFSEVMENFIQILRLKLTLSRLGAVKADVSEQRLLVTWMEDQQCMDVAAFLQWVDSYEQARLMPPAKLELRLGTDVTIAQGLARLNSGLGELVLAAVKMNFKE